MDGRDDPEQQYSRIPTLDDLVDLCRNLNAHGVRYVVIGGFAVIRHGYVRATADIDLLVENTVENIRKLRAALAYLPDAEAEQIQDNDLTDYQVIRVAGEITVDLLAKACEMSWPISENDLVYDEIDGVRIPYLKPKALIKTKLGVRPKDIQDRTFLDHLIRRPEQG